MDLSDAIVVDGIEYRVLLEEYVISHVIDDIKNYMDEVYGVFVEPDPGFPLRLGTLVAELFEEAIFQVEPTIDSMDGIPRFLHVSDISPLVNAARDEVAFLASVFWTRLDIKRQMERLPVEVYRAVKRVYWEKLHQKYELTGGNPLSALPQEMQIRILSTNPGLSVVDILRMSRVNKDFNELNRQGYIWEAIFNRQFGEKAFKQAEEEFSTPWWQDYLRGRPSWKSLMMLLVWRIYTSNSKLYATTYWDLEKQPEDIYISHMKIGDLHVINLHGSEPFLFKTDIIHLLETFPWSRPSHEIWRLPRGQRHGENFTPELERKIIYLLLASGFRTKNRTEYVGQRVHG